MRDGQTSGIFMPYRGRASARGWPVPGLPACGLRGSLVAYCGLTSPRKRRYKPDTSRHAKRGDQNKKTLKNYHLSWFSRVFEDGGGSTIRTLEGVSQQIYSLPPLATWVTHLGCVPLCHGWEPVVKWGNENFKSSPIPAPCHRILIHWLPGFPSSAKTTPTRGTPRYACQNPCNGH